MGIWCKSRVFQGFIELFDILLVVICSSGNMKLDIDDFAEKFGPIECTQMATNLQI